MKIGILGLGSIGMRHANNLLKLGHNVIGYDPDMRRRLMLNGVLWSREEILGEANVDATVIASPTVQHHQDLMNCMLANNKPIFVEKPISHVYDSAFKTWGNPIMTGYNLRFHPCIIQTKKWIDAGKIGKPLWANFYCAQFNDKPAYLRDGVILNWSHEIDAALHILGPGHLEASSTRIVDGQDDMTDILLTHESGCRSSIHLDYLTKIQDRHFKIAGTEGYIYGELVSRYCSLAEDGEIVHYDSKTFYSSYDDDYIDEMKAFIDRVNGKEALGCTGEEALRVLEICLQVRKAAGL